MSEYKNKSRRIDASRVTQIAAELIRRESESPPGNEAATADYIHCFLEKLGVPVTRQKCAEGRENIFARLAGDRPGKNILYCGHMDVVSAGDWNRWQTPPYAPEERGGRLYGRGACDMKGSIACALYAAEMLAPRRSEFAGEFGLLFVVDEEYQNLGCREWLKNPMSSPDIVIIGEPTGLELALGHRGVMAFEVTFTGNSVHAARHFEGKNAVGAAACLTRLIEGLDRGLRAKEASALGTASCAVTKINGGTKANVVPERCVMHIDRRLTVGDTRESCSLELESLLRQTEKETGCEWDYSVITHCPSSLIGEDSPALALIDGCINSALGNTLKHTLFTATCEAGLFMEKGIPAAIIGPGDIAQAHNTDEFVEIEQLAGGARIYAGLVAEMLGVSSFL